MKSEITVKVKSEPVAGWIKARIMHTKLATAIDTRTERADTQRAERRAKRK